MKKLTALLGMAVALMGFTLGCGEQTQQPAPPTPANGEQELENGAPNGTTPDTTPDTTPQDPPLEPGGAAAPEGETETE